MTFNSIERLSRVGLKISLVCKIVGEREQHSWKIVGKCCFFLVRLGKSFSLRHTIVNLGYPASHLLLIPNMNKGQSLICSQRRRRRLFLEELSSTGTEGSLLALVFLPECSKSWDLFRQAQEGDPWPLLLTGTVSVSLETKEGVSHAGCHLRAPVWGCVLGESVVRGWSLPMQCCVFAHTCVLASPGWSGGALQSSTSQTVFHKCYEIRLYIDWEMREAVAMQIHTFSIVCEKYIILCMTSVWFYTRSLIWQLFPLCSWGRDNYKLVCWKLREGTFI